MYWYIKSLYEDVQRYCYNRLHNADEELKKCNRKYPKKNMFEDYQSDIDDKQLRVDTLLYIKQYKNVYYKYTNKSLFNPELYNYYSDNNTFFDSGKTAYDDDDDTVKIFDKYILEYIKNRNDFITHLQCKNKQIVQQTSFDMLREYKKGDSHIDVIFIMDMKERDIFLYIYGLIKEGKGMKELRGKIYSVIIRSQGEEIRIEITSFKNNHPYIILNSIL
jgi:hypothetical protein